MDSQKRILHRLPLFYYPCTWLFLDDDQLLLNSLTQAFSTQSKILSFQSSNTCKEFFRLYNLPFSQQTFLKSVTDNENYGSLRNMPVNFDVTSIASLANDSRRYDEISTMVIDHNMPEMNGFEFIKSISHFSIPKILLTGKVSEKEAVDGFNNNLIQRFVQKGEYEFFEKLSLYLKELNLLYFQKRTEPLYAYIEAETILPLSDQGFIKFFENYCENNYVREYYLIDKQGSFLCIDSKKEHSLLIVHTDQSINDWINLYGNDQSLSADDLILVKEKKKIPFFGIGKEAWQIESSLWSQYFHPSFVLEGKKKYYWAKVDCV